MTYFFSNMAREQKSHVSTKEQSSLTTKIGPKNDKIIKTKENLSVF